MVAIMRLGENASGVAILRFTGPVETVGGHITLGENHEEAKAPSVTNVEKVRSDGLVENAVQTIQRTKPLYQGDSDRRPEPAIACSPRRSVCQSLGVAH